MKVDSKVIETVLDRPGRLEVGAQVFLLNQLQLKASTRGCRKVCFEGLPKGLSFDGTTITGTPVVDDDN